MLRRSTCVLNVSQVWLKTFLLVEFHYLWVGVQWLTLLLTSKTIPAFLVLSDHIRPELSRLRFPYSFPFCKLPWYCVPFLYTLIPPFPPHLLPRSLVETTTNSASAPSFRTLSLVRQERQKSSGQSRLSMPPLYQFSWAVWKLLRIRATGIAMPKLQ